MIEYIKNNTDGSTIFLSDIKIDTKKSCMSVIKEICIDFCMTYEGYIKAIKKSFNYTYKIPLYLAEDLCFIQSERARNYENVWINYFSIENIKSIGQELEITFMSGKKLLMKGSLTSYNEQIKRIHQIQKRKVNIFIPNLIEKVYK